MSSEHEVGGQDGETGIEAAAVQAAGLRTPLARLEPPIAVKVLSPSTSSDSLHSSSGQDYFNLKGPTSSAEQLPALASILTAPTAVTGTIATGQIESASVLSPMRPSPQSHISSLSVESTDSVATITATPTRGSAVSRPAFPNQSYAALHSQQYHTRQHPPQILRQRSSHPGQIHTFTSALASLHNTGTRTVGNSPAVTPGPGLYSPSAAPPTDDYESAETQGTYASPFLHFTQRQAPKETHVADVDVDPVSGRKLINHYEIIDELGRGTHGKVKLGRDLHTEDTHVAIKIVERYSKRRKLGKLVSAAEDKVKKEVAILKKVRHPNIVTLLEVIDDPTRKKVYIVLEYVHRGEIKWRTNTSKEIAIVEASRYERERKGRHDARAEAETAAVLLEAQRRLAKEQRRQTIAHRNRARRGIGQDAGDEHNFSLETGWDEVSEESEEDRLSRISTSTTLDTAGGLFAGGRRESRAYSPLPPRSLVASPISESQPAYLSLTSEPPTASPSPAPQESESSYSDRLAGSMYGPYAMSSSTDSSRANSLANSDAYIDPAELVHLAKDIMDSEISPELMYAPLLTLQETRVAFRDTLLGLQYLHYQGIVHRDIKPPNLLQTFDHRVKISDFGVSYLGRPMEEGEASEDVSEHEALDFDEAKELAKTVGTPAFYAPELCIAEPGEDPLPVTKAIDVWALGITLFCMLFARTPYVDNEFVVMRMIADEEVYIPRKRLLPVNDKPPSRPSSHGRAFPPRPLGRRNEFDILYEDIDDDLYDLLKRLLIKDPRKRITLEEVRHHPWVVADLQNRMKWLEETDPGRQSQGKKIEVSNEDVKTAVIPLQFLDRVRSGIKKVTDRLGFSSSKISSSRGRTGSTAGLGGNLSNTASPIPSASSSSSTLAQDQRRPSLFSSTTGDDIYSAIKASRHGDRQGEHPLSRSVAASPEVERQSGFFDPKSPHDDTANQSPELTSPSRPYLPERSKTAMSTADSIRTLKQADYHRGRETSPSSPGLPSAPVALDSPGGHGLQAIMGSGAARRAFRSLRERSTPRGSHIRDISEDRESTVSSNAHGEPSVAVSQTSVEGHMNLPQALQELASNDSYPNSIQDSRQNSRQNSRHTSPVASRSHSAVGLAHELLLPRAGRLSRNSSNTSIKSVNVAELARSTARLQPATINESSAEDWQRADDERIRKLINERRDEIERPPSAFDDRTCPPSPDDDAVRRRESRQVSFPNSLDPISSHETSPSGHITNMPPALVSSSSDFGSAMSMSMSNPSIPSVISEASSVDPIDRQPLEKLDEERRNVSSDDTLSPDPGSALQKELEEEGYSPDKEEVVDSDNDDDVYDSSSDSDGGLVMSRRKSKTSTTGEMLAAALERPNAKGRRFSARSKKSSRSGSTNTMKKVRTRDSEDERRQAELKVSEE
ncbi:hypothetical protein LTS10_000832 [Elasticomyces elasticus]|nr:hypothetical protein LTS10_000832 [Elasticomyces elasticus]